MDEPGRGSDGPRATGTPSVGRVAAMTWWWKAVGGMALAIAAIAIVVPLLPTTPFVLLAAGAFARGSPRVHAWLTSHSRWGPIIDAWRRDGAIPGAAKIAALVLMLGSAASGWLAGTAPAWLLVHGLVILAAGTWILTRPTAKLPRVQEARSEEPSGAERQADDHEQHRDHGHRNDMPGQ